MSLACMVISGSCPVIAATPYFIKYTAKVSQGKTTSKPFREEEAILDQDGEEKEHKALNDQHHNVSASDVPTEWISNQILP